MRIIPVIDLMNGRVVRGVAGQRDSYQAVESEIAAEPTPTSVANALADRFGFDEVYVADLDAIGGLPPDERSCEEIAASGMRLWLDAGITDAARAKTVLEIASENSHIVVGLESIASADDLQGVFSAIPGGRGVFSLDLKGGVPMANSTAWRRMNSEKLLNGSRVR